VSLLWTIVIQHPAFWIAAVLWSTFLGLYAPDSLGRGIAAEDTTWKPEMWKQRRLRRGSSLYKGFSWCAPGIIREHVLNFAGSFVGWIALFYLWFYRVYPNIAANQAVKLDATDLVVAVVAILGVFGYLPFTAFKATKLGP